MLKVRSATYFYSAETLDEAIDGMRVAAGALGRAKEVLSSTGFEVQTVRAAMNSFEDYTPDATPASEVVAGFKRLEEAAAGVDFISVGVVRRRFDVLEAALSGSTEKTFFVVPLDLGASGLPDLDAAKRVAEVVCRLGAASPAKTTQVPALFRMTVSANLGAGTPYFPGGFWERGQPAALGLALEDSGLLVRACAGAPSLEVAQHALEEQLTEALLPLEEAGQRAAAAASALYAGMDCSVASSSDPAQSVVVAFESLGLGLVGGAGTLGISAMVTAVLKRLPLKRCGYVGLMLPLTEDAGLAQRAGEGRLSVQQLLFYSSVCGTGIDTVPVEGSTAPERLAMVYFDMASLAFRLGKPLSARLWPVAGKRAGDLTEVDNPFFVNSRVLSVDPPGPPTAPAPAAELEALAGLGGEASVLGASSTAVVVRLEREARGLCLVLRNVGRRPWPRGARLECLGTPCGTPGASVLELPPVPGGEAVTVALAFEGCAAGSHYGLRGGSGEAFGPVIVVSA